MREFLEELERRKAAKDDPCDSCYGTGGVDGEVCLHCLGQGVLLTGIEYIELLKISGHLAGDDILDAEFLDGDTP